MIFNQDFKEFIESLNKNNVRYLVVGGYAVAMHGYPRFTKDLDIWIDSTAKNADSIITALYQFGMASLGLKAKDFLVADQVIQLGYPPNRIDILVTLTGVDFNFCYEKRLIVEIGHVKINFIDLQSLRENKKASGRAQDLADLENLQ